MAQPSLWGNALQDAFANPMTLGGLSLLSGGDLNSGIRSGAALQQQVQQQRQRDATQESLKGMFADPNSQFSKLDAGSRSLLESNPDMAADVFMKRLSQQMDPMAGLDADYKRAQIDKLRREAQTAGNDVYGNNGQIFQGSDGRWYSYQFAKNGRNLMQPINAPSAPQANGGGAPVTVSPFRGVSQADTPTDVQIFDKGTGAPVRTISKDVAGAASLKEQGEAEGKAIADLPRQIDNAQLALDTIDAIRKHPGKQYGLGVYGVLPGVPGTQQRGFVNLVDQAKGQVFLQAFNSLRGGGQITEAEGSKATQALARMDRAQTQADFDQALDDYATIVQNGISRARTQATRAPAVPGSPSTPPSAASPTDWRSTFKRVD